MENINDEQTVLTSISTGQYDTILDELVDTVNARRRAMAFTTIHTLKPGDKVRFVRGRPRYLIGEIATVKKVMQTWVTVVLDTSIGKFRAGAEIRTPGTLLEPVK